MRVFELEKDMAYVMNTEKWISHAGQSQTVHGIIYKSEEVLL